MSQSQFLVFDASASNRYEDANGFLCVRSNPIAMSGVFDYYGHQIGYNDHRKNDIFKVYRPFSELEKTAKMFEGMPITVQHKWFEGDASNPTVMGIISGQVTAKEPYLYADIKIINDEARRVIESGEIKELSPGYSADFYEEEGEYNGIPYTHVQKDMHYNHLALVENGRSGPTLKVLDSVNVNNDRGGPNNMAKRNGRFEDVDIDKLSRLLLEFFEEEKAEEAHGEPMEVGDDGVPTMFDEELPEGSAERELFAKLIEPVGAADDNDDDDVVVVESEEDDVTEDEDDVTEDEDDVTEDEDDVTENNDTVDRSEVNRIVESAVAKALRAYKNEHAKTLKAVEDVAPVVGALKTYDSAGHILSERAIYRTACNRLGITGVKDYKSAFKAARVMHAKMDSMAKSAMGSRRVSDTADAEELATVDALIKNAFRY